MERFFCKTQIYAGNGSLRILPTLHIKRLLIVADPYFAQNGTTNHIAHISGAQTVEVFSKVIPDPSVALVAEGTQMVHQFQPDAILALGGGSAMDCAKAMAYFSGLDAALIAVPTTSGSGSEVTDFAILTHDGIKHPLVDEKLRPDIAILDDALLQNLPKTLIAASGFDLVSHAVEAWTAKDASAFSDAMAADALQIAFPQLPRSYAGDLNARMPVHTAATMAGVAFSTAGLGLCHAISHALGGEFHIPHGQLNAILLPAVMDCNAPQASHRYGDLARRLGISTGTDAVATRALKNRLIRLRRELQLPDSLSAAGVSSANVRAQLDRLVEAALADPCCKTNPTEPQPQQVKKILLQVAGHG